MTSTPVVKRFKKINIPPTPQITTLGYGTGVNVWKVKNPETKSPWALKNVRCRVPEDYKSHYQSLVQREVSILKTLCHENVVSFRGELQGTDGRVCLAMELCGKSLGDLIEEREEPFSPDEIYKVILGVAKGLKYLHEEKNILHGDLKSFNILIKDNFDTIKLCDFGVYVELDDQGKADHYTGTHIYLAPECLEETVSITAKAEIFSFGLVIYEMLALKPPHCQVSECESFEDSEESFWEQEVGTRPDLPDWLENRKDYEKIVKIYNSCTESDPTLRPSASEILKMI